MKFKLTLISNGINNVIPLNYQYEFSSWIYKTIHSGNPEFAKWLHEQGYTSGNKKYKLFTFSKLLPEKYRIKADRLEILSGKAFFHISFYMNQAAEPFILGLFKNQEFSIGDKYSNVHFQVNAIEKLAEPLWANEMYFRADSPIIISIIDENISRNAQYLAPDNKEYERYFTQNLLSKYITLLSTQPELRQVINLNKDARLEFKLLGNPKSKLVKIKAGTPDETMLRGFLFDFALTAPLELMQLGYYGGFGEKNSLGFGSVEVANNMIKTN